MPSPHSRQPDPAPHAGPATGQWTPPTRDSADPTGDYRPADAPADPRVPGFEVLGVLGRGGMGVVYQARQAKLNRVVALKMILGDRAQPRVLNRFLVEAEAAAAVKHPHVAQVFEYGEHAGMPFLVMEYLPGGSLGHRLKGNTRLDAVEAAELVEKLAGGVQAIHDAGVVHRDLKPANVLLDEAGEPKVTDFGLAKRGDNNELTAAGSVMGTPAYMSPEQARGDTKFVGPAADVYALGVILYQCLTGTRPFDGDDTIGLLRRVAEEEPERPRKRVPGVPRDVELICLKCLAKAPHERYTTAKALADDLGRFVAGEPVSLRPAGVLERAAKWAKRKPALAAAYGLTTVSLVLIALTAGAVWLWQEAEKAKGFAESARDGEMEARSIAEAERKTANDARVTAEGAKNREELAKREIAFLNYAHGVDLAYREWGSNNLARARELLNECPLELRSWEWHYVHRLCHANLITLSGTRVALSPDGRRAVTALGTDAYAWDAETGRQMCEFKGHTSPIHSAAFSPNGLSVVTTSFDGTARVWDSATGRARTELRGHSAGVINASFSADGTRVVTASQDKTARVWDPESGRALMVLKGHTGIVSGATFSPTERGRVLTSSEDGTARLWNSESGEEIARLGSENGSNRWAVFSRDGRRVVTNTSMSTGAVWDASTGRRLVLLTGDQSRAGRASFSPDGSKILTASLDGTAHVWEATTGRHLVALRGHTAKVVSVQFSPDGQRVVTASEDLTARLWDVGGEALAELRGHTAKLYSASFTPDGRRVLTCAEDGTTRIWLATATDELVLKNPAPITVAACSNDGRRVLTAAAQDNIACVWDARTGQIVAQVPTRGRGVAAVAFSSDGQRFATVSTLQLVDKLVQIWDTESGREVTALHGHQKRINSVALSADGRFVATASSDRTARLWDADTGRQLSTFTDQHNEVRSVSFSADARQIVTGVNTGTLNQSAESATARLWDSQTSASIAALGGHPSPISRVTFSNDGRRIFVCAQDGSVTVWNANDHTRQATLKGHTRWAHSVSQRRDGTRIVTTSQDQTTRVWDSRSGKLLLTLPARVGSVLDAAFDSDGHVLVTVEAEHRDRKFARVVVYDSSQVGQSSAIESGAPRRATRTRP